MSDILGSIPYFRCLVRKQYLRDLQDNFGDFVPATAVAVLCVRGDSLQFLVVLHEPLAGCAFTVPIEALCTKPCEPAATKVVAPWDTFAVTFGVCEITTLRRGAVRLLKDNCFAEYRFTLSFTGNDLADDPAQRKLLHVVHREDGLIGAYPNNRMVFLDRALFGDLTAKPDFLTLTKEFRAEGVPALGVVNLPDIKSSTPLNGVHTDPKERPEWLAQQG